MYTGPSRRGDLEALGYCMLEWMCGTLPWASSVNKDIVCAQKVQYVSLLTLMIGSGHLCTMLYYCTTVYYCVLPCVMLSQALFAFSMLVWH